MVISAKKILSVIWPALAFLLLPVSRAFADFTVVNATFTVANGDEFWTSTITINSGGVLTGGSSKIRVLGNWANAGAFNAGASTVAFENGAATSAITGNTTFYSFVSEAAGKTITFAANSTQAVTNVFSVAGAAGELIKLRSSADGVKWGIRFPNGPQTVSYIDVKDSNALLNTVTVGNSINSGNNNANWLSGSAPTLNWTGEANYTADGLDPETGDRSTDFVYRVEYTDADNDAPAAGYPRVYVLKGGTTVQVLAMNYVSSVSSGAIYSTTTILSSPGTDYSYYFAAYDVWGAAATGIATGTINAPDVIDTSSPTVTAFTIPATATSLTVPITAFTATDNIAVTGYLVNESAVRPLPGAGGWVGSAPVDYPFATEGVKTLYAWAKDGAGNVSTSLSAPVTVDITSPTVTAFTIPDTAVSLTVPITAFTATDNFAVTGYLLNESAVRPLPGAGGWAGTAPASYTFATEGVKTLYAWAKDAAGNVSTTLSSRTVTVDITSPTVTAFTIPATAVSLTVPITAFTATDNFAVTGYLVNESAVRPLPGAGGWAGSAPASYTFATDGEKTLYAWAKDALGNVSTSLNASVTVDITSPTVTAFTIPATASSLTVAITAFTAADNIAVTGYLVNESAVRPLPGAGGWAGTAPASYTFATEGVKTLYAWAKDAAGYVSISLNDSVTVTIAPILSWTGEAGYTADGLNPETGDLVVSFVYRVKYSHDENEAPAAGYPEVHIKKGGAEITGSPFAMSFVSGAYSAGAIYTYSNTLAAPGMDYTYYFLARDAAGDWATGPAINPVDAPDVAELARQGSFKTTLGNNLFSPRSGGTVKIKFTLTAPGRVSLKIYDMSLKLVRTLYEGEMPAGAFQKDWDGRNDGGRYVPPEIYFLHYVYPGGKEVRKIGVKK